nr:MAG TPA: hypothetical protein [Bacteriophage sp.]
MVSISNVTQNVATLDHLGRGSNPPTFQRKPSRTKGLISPH